MEAFIKKNGVTKCPGVGSPELMELHKKQHQQWLGSVSTERKRTLGFKIDEDRLKDDLAGLPLEIPVGRNGQALTPAQIKKNAYFREYNRKKRLERLG